MSVAPSNLVDRLEAVVSPEIDVAIAELEALVAETQALLVEHMPDFDPTLRRGPGNARDSLVKRS